MDAGPGPLPRAQRALSATWRLAVLLVVVAGLALVLAHSLRVYFAQSQEIAAVRAALALTEEVPRWCPCPVSPCCPACC